MPRKSPTPAVVAPWRLGAVVLLLLVLAALVLGRLVLIQVVDEERGAAFLKHQGALRTVRTAEMPAYRGMLVDRRGEPLAISTPVVTLWADPRQLAGSDRLSELASALDRSDDWLAQQLSLHANKHFMYLRRNETPDRARRVLELRLPGVAGSRAYKRFYPAGEVTSQVIGLTDIDAKGIEGMERAYDAVLHGQPGQRRYIKDLHGEAVRDIGVVREAQPGRDISLTIDLRLQYLQHRELQRAIAETGSEAGAAVTIDARTGEILAMTSHPVFNPNRPTRHDGGARRNRVVTDTFEPGSTVKPLTLVAALETGQFTIDSVIDTSPGRIKVGSKVLPDPLNYGAITVSKVIEKSSQVGVTKIAQAIGHEPVLDVYRRFGLGQVSNIGFPGERSGSLPDRQRWSDIEKVTLAFGYGLTATPLQLAHAYSVFANGGEQAPLSLVRADAEGVLPAKRVVSKDIAAQVLTVLHRVTGEDGTGKKARVAGFAVGGKTGTVHKVGAGGYLPDQYLALFVGIAPVDNPRYVTAIVLDQPKGDSYGGGAAAAPLYARITDGVLRLYNQRPQAEPGAGLQLAAMELAQ